MPLEPEHFLAVARVPQADGIIVAAGGHELAVRRNGHGVYGIRVSAEGGPLFRRDQHDAQQQQERARFGNGSQT